MFVFFCVFFSFLQLSTFLQFGVFLRFEVGAVLLFLRCLQFGDGVFEAFGASAMFAALRFLMFWDVVDLFAFFRSCCCFAVVVFLFNVSFGVFDVSRWI